MFYMFIRTDLINNRRIFVKIISDIKRVIEIIETKRF